MSERARAPYPYGYIGDGVTRCVVLSLPTWKVQPLLPPGLELREQDVTASGTHPIVMQFHDFSQCRFSVPNPFEPLNFHEQTFGIPFTRISSRFGATSRPDSYYFMPRLYLDHPWVWAVGRNLWGFDKMMAAVEATHDRYTVTSFSGRQLASLSWSYRNKNSSPAAAEAPGFPPIRNILSQTLISLSPAALGPLLTLTDFERDWDRAMVRPISAALVIDPCYVQGFDGGRFGTDFDSGDAEYSLIGCYEVTAQWWLSFPYLPLG